MHRIDIYKTSQIDQSSLRWRQHGGGSGFHIYVDNNNLLHLNPFIFIFKDVRRAVRIPVCVISKMYARFGLAYHYCTL